MLVVAIGIAVVLAVLVALRINRWRQTPPELRGDWWAEFEEDFWAYVCRLEQSRRPRRRRSDQGPIGPVG